MKKLFPITIVAFAAAAIFVSDVHADANDGVCNAIVANGLRGAQVCYNMSCVQGDAACMDVTDAFVDFLMTPGCLDAYAAGELNGLPGNAIIQPGGPNTGGAKHIQDVICDAVEECGLCAPALSAGICVTQCSD